jgi:hypothetical protein
MLELINDVASVPDGFSPYRTAAAWLRWNLGLSARTARRWAHAAELVDTHPRLLAHLATGAVTIDHLMVIHRYLTPDNADSLLDRAIALDAEELRLEMKEQFDDPPAVAPVDPPPTWFRGWWTDDRFGFEGEIAGADGLVVETALLRLAADAPVDPASGLHRDPPQKMGEALVQLASECIARDSDPDRATLVVHIPLADLAQRSGRGWDAAGRLIGPADLERLTCDARIQPSIHDENGITVGVGRTTRAIPPWLRRIVVERDRGCRFPGCRTSRWVHVHHLREWSADRGPTNLDNLIALCGFHHRLVHAQRWTIAGDPNHELVFLNRFGEQHQPVRHANAASADQLHRSITHSSGYRRRLLEAMGPIVTRPPPQESDVGPACLPTDASRDRRGDAPGSSLW